MLQEKSVGGITDYGGNGKVVILLHGFMANSIYWRRLQPYLTKAGYHVITIDLLGFGRASDVRAMNYDYEEHVEYIHARIASLQLNEPFTLIGHSMGGLLAARYSVVYPQKIIQLLLLNPPLYKDREEAYQALRSTGVLYRFILDSRYRNIVWRIVNHLPNGKHATRAREKSLTNIIEAAELFADLDRLDVSTDLLIGLKDRPQYAHNVAHYKLADHITVRAIQAGHHSPVFSPKEVARIVMTRVI